jgi:uncharacterized membrane protein YeaQ/YmgE (transglycosylase-associated protein family)
MPAARRSRGSQLHFFTLFVVGVISGLTASAAVGGFRQSLAGDVAVGVVGAVGGGWLFNALEINHFVGGLTGTIIVASVGAGLLLLLFRFLRPGRLFA